eukprot:CAMPEP_0175135546 /NCGR_PEP_ID=MMETSP0087-20121206/8794_1 /TAXON_ID=136419 /ORGANISM="Unknown Unknown, Strain D1" /LENGTH=669 /DNA_ID=CAMNT_0016418231 /DNA_START=32 /DNA_END=2041 /DNA_ORIENTATION=+
MAYAPGADQEQEKLEVRLRFPWLDFDCLYSEQQFHRYHQQQENSLFKYNYYWRFAFHFLYLVFNIFGLLQVYAFNIDAEGQTKYTKTHDGNVVMLGFHLTALVLYLIPFFLRRSQWAIRTHRNFKVAEFITSGCVVAVGVLFTEMMILVCQIEFDDNNLNKFKYSVGTGALTAWTIEVVTIFLFLPLSGLSIRFNVLTSTAVVLHFAIRVAMIHGHTAQHDNTGPLIFGVGSMAFVWFNSNLASYCGDLWQRSTFLQLRKLKRENMNFMVKADPFSVTNLKKWLRGDRSDTPEEEALENPEVEIKLRFNAKRQGNGKANKGVFGHGQAGSGSGGGTRSLSECTGVSVSPSGLGRWEIDFSALKIVQKIAGGGGGQVFKAEFANQLVAVKQIFATIIDPEDLEELSNEVTTLSRIGNHPNVVKFIGLAKQAQPEESLYLVMEWCDHSLHDELEQHADQPSSSSSSSSSVVGTCLQIAVAMDFLHQNKLTHNDLKPLNVLIDTQGVAKLCDFGMAKSLEKKDSNLAESSGGTLPYMAPENLRASPSLFAAGAAGHAPGHAPEPCQGSLFRSDVWAFGVLLCAILTRNRPWDAAWAEFKQSPQYKDLPIEVGMSEEEEIGLAVALCSLRPKLPEVCPPELTSLVMLCLAEDPVARPSFSDLVRALQQMADNI